MLDSTMPTTMSVRLWQCQWDNDRYVFETDGPTRTLLCGIDRLKEETLSHNIMQIDWGFRIHRKRVAIASWEFTPSSVSILTDRELCFWEYRPFAKWLWLGFQWYVIIMLTSNIRPIIHHSLPQDAILYITWITSAYMHSKIKVNTVEHCYRFIANKVI